MMEFRVTGPRPPSIRPADFRRAIRETFRAARRREGGSVAVVFLSNAKMRTVNRRFRTCDRPTDVLSFSSAPMRWGDILVAPAYVRASAKAQGVPFREELLRVTVHGLLHLFGYDHATTSQERRMFAIQERVVRKMKP